MTFSRQTIQTVVARTMSLFLGLCLAACGGGGGGGGSAPAATVPSGPATSAACAAKRSVAGADVVLLIGQSNMAGYGAYFVAGFDTTDPRILQWATNGTAQPAADPLAHPDSAAPEGRIGPGMPFARAYLKTLPESRRVLLVPAAVGGTGFFSKHWNPGDVLYKEAVRRTNQALNSDPAGNCMAAILWSQGEADVGVLSNLNYAAALDRMISGLRTEILAASGVATAPFVLGQFSPEWVTDASPLAKQAILDAINDTPTHIAYTTVVSTSGLRSNNTQGLNGSVHLDAASQRIYGQRYFDALPAALANSAAR